MSGMPKETVLFLNPPWKRGRGNVWRFVSGITPPIGIATLAAVLEEHDVSAGILDAQALRMDEDAVVSAVVSRAPDWLGISTSTPITMGAYRIAVAVKMRMPDMRIVFGGPHPSALPAEPLEEGAADYVLTGEAETTLPRLIAGDAPESVPGLSWQDNGAVRHNPPPALIENLDDLPMPAFDKLPIEKYHPSLGNYRVRPCLGITLTRGCYGRCTFCYRHLFGSRVRPHSPGRIIETLEMLKTRYVVKEVQFYDDIFLGTKERIHSFCHAVLSRSLGMLWVCNMRAELTDDATMRLMRKAGCYMVDYGIENGNPALLGSMKKNVDLERTIDSMHTARRAGMQLKSGFMIGYPGETRADMQRTIATARRAAPDAAMFNIVTPFPGTEIFAQCEADGTLLSKHWEDYDYAHPLIRLPDADAKDLLRIYRKAYSAFYLRPSMVWRWLRIVRSPEQLRMAFDAFVGLMSLVFVERRRALRKAES
jgi:anaerobic magnesium-protoporphyrin IX monomethyl ester cyclase